MLASKKLNKKVIVRMTRKGEKNIAIRVARGNKANARKCFEF